MLTKDKKTNKFWPLFATPILIGLIWSFSDFYFSSRTESNIKSLEAMVSESMVAGASTTGDEISTDDFPVISGADVISLDTRNGTSSLILESDKEDVEINTFYEDYMYENGWILLDSGKYSKDRNTMSIEIDQGIIKLVLE